MGSADTAIKDARAVPQEVRESLDAAASAVTRKSKLLRDELREYRDALEWDKLCVVLYGPTNAGKSTIIEALCQGDGRTIGPGDKDHTKEPREVLYGSLLLVDAPGIEGAEGELRRHARAAIRRAHVVVVVTGTGKEPEAGALTKTAEDAQRASEILSVLNIRGRPTAYRPHRNLRRPTLRTQRVTELEARIQLAMSGAFAERYTEHVSINAYLALVATPGSEPRFRDEQLQRDRALAREAFGTCSDVTRLSGISDLVSKLDDLIRETRSRVLWANGFKAVTALGDASTELDRAALSLADVASRWHDHVSRSKQASRSAIERRRRLVDGAVKSRLGSFANDLTETIGDGLNRGLAAMQVQQNISERAKQVNLDLKSDIESELHALQQDLRTEIDLLEERLDVGSLSFEFESPEMAELFRRASLSISGEFLDVVQRSLRVLWLWLWRGNPIAGIIAAVTQVVIKIWDWFLGGKRRRRREILRKAHGVVRKHVLSVKKIVAAELDHVFDSLNRQVSRCFDPAGELTADLRRISSALANAGLTLDLAAARLTTRFLVAGEGGKGACHVLLPIQTNAGKGIEMVVHVGDEPCRLIGLPNLPTVRNYPGRRCPSTQSESYARAASSFFCDHSEDDG